ncbi:hypothetical protein ACT17_32665 [Mycolicibacterium conceptionense]|uniref:Uncharacterized protein n=1 Tax=Mycolicibacterium conceptionense TaxID=451644 RepID=A0A0J8TWX7_9MYCO|nr:hypothetical protein [Mycolicibacterium conceptionense]KMV13936.1 hypothetical protein ACT17_32665 [Mycolicibacterium conceptionense]
MAYVASDGSIQLTDEEKRTKAATVAMLRERAEKLHVEVGQVWEYIGAISLVRPDRRTTTSGNGSRIRIVQVAGQGRARTTRYVKVNPPRGGNGGYDRQDHPINSVDLVRAYRLVEEESS